MSSISFNHKKEAAKQHNITIEELETKLNQGWEIKWRYSNRLNKLQYFIFKPNTTGNKITFL